MSYSELVRVVLLLFTPLAAEGFFHHPPLQRSPVVNPWHLSKQTMNLAPQPRYSTFGGAEAGAAVGADDDYEGVLQRSLDEEMMSVAMDWGKGNETAASSAAATAGAKVEKSGSEDGTTGRFSEWEPLVTMPSFHKVYYGGEQERFFWKQSRETVHLYVPVPTDTFKETVRFEMVTKTHIILSVGDDVILDRELAYPVYKGNSYWYFERPDGTHKLVVVELDKRLDYANWPKLFPEDPDLVVQQQEEGAAGSGQGTLTEEQKQELLAGLQTR